MATKNQTGKKIHFFSDVKYQEHIQELLDSSILSSQHSISSQNSHHSDHSFHSFRQRQVYERAQNAIESAIQKETKIKSMKYSNHKRSHLNESSKSLQNSRQGRPKKAQQKHYRVFHIPRLFSKVKSIPTEGRVSREHQEQNYNPFGEHLKIRSVQFRKVVRQVEVPSVFTWQKSKIEHSPNYYRNVELSQQQYLHTLSQLQGHPFQDWEFPASPKNFGLKGSNVRRIGSCKCVLWKYFDSAGLVPGLLGAEFCSVLACLTPQLIVNLFQNQTFNKQGIYFVKIFREGVWRYTLIDDKLPFNHQKEILSTITKGAELWPALIEKAFIKIYGTQSRTAGAMLNNLTGGIVEVQKKLVLPDEDFIVLGRPSENIREIGLDPSFLYQVTGKDKSEIALKNAFGWQEKSFSQAGTDFTLSTKQVSSMFKEFITCKLIPSSARSESFQLSIAGTASFSIKGDMIIVYQKNNARTEGRLECWVGQSEMSEKGWWKVQGGECRVRVNMDRCRGFIQVIKMGGQREQIELQKLD